MAKRGGDQLTIEGTDTELSKACDKLLEAQTGMQEARGEYDSCVGKMLSLMKNSGKKSIKHDGRIIRWTHVEEKDKIQIKSAGD